MPTLPENPKLDYRGRWFGPRVSGLLTKALAVAVGVTLLIGAVAISFVLFAVALTGLLILGIYVWWKTRELRRELKSRMRRGDVIEGEVVREVRVDDTTGANPSKR
jgi:membrane protein implicated in regulation of membrane protease activity